MTTTRPLLLLLLLGLAVSARAAIPASISVDASSSPGPVNRLVFGQNIEAADNARIFSSDVTDPLSIGAGGGFWDPAKGAPVPAILERCREAGIGLLRYPGGCLAHNYDWRRAVGPPAERGDWKFGIDEYLALCRAVGAEPMFTVSDYVLPADEMPANAAGLVEYLNAPATPGHPWAVKRKEWGHPEPYGVRWFELGNESDHGNHRVVPFRKYDAAQYAAYANATAAAMRAVDPSIRIGIVMIPGAGTDVDDAWNRTVVRLAGKAADFLIVHLYAPGGGSGPDELLARSCMAAGEQSERHLDEYRELARREAGRELPLAVTEFNGGLPREPKPYQFSYAEGLECADLLRVFLDPARRVEAAAYWQFLNGAFGMLRSDRKAPDGGAIEGKPAYPLFRLWGRHFGTRLAAVRVDGPRAAFPGSGSVYPAEGDAYVPSRPLGPVPAEIRFAAPDAAPGAAGAFAFRFGPTRGLHYPPIGTLAVPGDGNPREYEISFEARFVPDPGSAAGPVGLGIGDSRGWKATHSALAFRGLGTEWREYRQRYHALPDTASLDLLARLESADTAVAGRIEVRGLALAAFSSPRFPAYALLTACASLSGDGKTLYLVVFNKSDRDDIPAALRLDGFRAAGTRRWEVNGPGLGALDGVAETVHGEPVDLSGPLVFPAHSMTALEIAGEAAR